jgi:hypothetical protein
MGVAVDDLVNASISIGMIALLNPTKLMESRIQIIRKYAVKIVVTVERKTGWRRIRQR